MAKKDKSAPKIDKKATKAAKKQIEVIDMGGAKTVKKKASVVKGTKRTWTIITLIWVALVIWTPLQVKNTYSEPIKKSIVVSMFFDLQRSIVEQYEKLLDGVKKSINLEKPIAAAIDGVKMAGSAVDKVTDTTAQAKNVTSQAKDSTAQIKDSNEKARKLTGFAGKLGINTSGADKLLDKSDEALGQVNKGINQADQAIGKVDDIAKMVNEKLDDVEGQLVKASQAEIDKIIDQVIKEQLDKSTGGLGTTLLTNYGIKHVYPWRPSSWGVATKIYNDLEKSDVNVVQILTRTVNQYFNYVAWGLVGAAWVVGFLIWLMFNKRVKLILAPFNVCPRCGHTYADKRSVRGFLNILKPWKWFA